jgi:hypothetical protein
MGWPGAYEGRRPPPMRQQLPGPAGLAGRQSGEDVLQIDVRIVTETNRASSEGLPFEWN